jgi:hypothetical protein
LVNQITEKSEKNGWSVLPRCSWLVLDSDGNPCCKYRALREHMAALRIAQFTSFDQRYVAEAIANWQATYPHDYIYSCAPKVCPSRLTRFLNELHK